MLVKKGNSISIDAMFNNDLLTLADSEEWSIWLKDTRNLANNTITVFMKAMERFWIWSLYNPAGMNESFSAYQARFRKKLRNGFEITIKISSDEFEDSVEHVVCSSKPMEKVTINKELSGINSYFYYTEESKMIEDHRFINKLYENQRATKGEIFSTRII